MSARIASIVLCFAALCLASCGSQAELDKLRGEQEKTRAELDALKAKSDAEEKTKSDAVAAKLRAESLEAEMRTRWNALGPALTVGGFNFRWNGPNAFPHPTFKGGSAEAYTAFAGVLVAFLEAGDNLDFMKRSGLFTAEIGIGLTSKVKLLDFADSLSKPGSLGAGDEVTRAKLEALVAKARAPKKA